MPGTIWENAAMTVAGAMSGGLGVFGLKWMASRKKASSAADASIATKSFDVVIAAQERQDAELRELREEIRGIRLEVNTERNRAVVAETRANQLAARIAELQTENRGLRMENEHLRETVAVLTAELEALRRDMSGTVIGRSPMPDAATA